MSTDIDQVDDTEFVKKRYDSSIGYYWNASRSNKRWYKLTRSLTVVLGALVTLIASLSSSAFVMDNEFWGPVFAIGTPILAALLSIIAGFSQSFQWGATWQDMVMTAQRLEKERDRFLVTDPEERDLLKEIDILNDFIIHESEGFFGRLLGSNRISVDKANDNDNNKKLPPVG
jgi:hypothetical protein